MNERHTHEYKHSAPIDNQVKHEKWNYFYTLSTFITDVRDVWATVVKSKAELVTVTLSSNRASTDTTAISAAVSVISIHT